MHERWESDDGQRRGTISLVTVRRAQPSSREVLVTYLDELGVRQGTYNLFGAHYLDDAVVLELRLEGWVVFYSERGGGCALSVHREEADACADSLAR